MHSMDQQRKDDHANFALDQQKEMKTSAFDEVRFVHHSFSQTNFDEIDLSVNWAGDQHSLPFYINGMTGGSAYTKDFNNKLSLLARETGLAMASGSVSAALKQAGVDHTFTIIRENNPKGFVMANLGAHHSLENAKRAVDLLKADALQIHLNTPQEVVMPEGDRDFSTWMDNIRNIVENVGVPVIVKEVGFGMSRETIETLVGLGVQTIDVSGRGGTNFVRIENQRRQAIDFSNLGNWGQTTPESLLESLPYQNKVEVLASGGIRHFYDIFRAIAMGARATGLSGKILATVHNEGVDAGVALVNEWATALKHLCLLVDAQSIGEVSTKQILIMGSLRDYAEARQIPWQDLAHR